MGKPCPRCGGDDRFYYVPAPRKGGPPFWTCSHCRHVERSGDAPHPGGREPTRRLTAPERQLAYRGYAAVAEWCATYLWTAGGKAALDYLRGRGFTDATIHAARLGYHPATHGYARTGDPAEDWGVGGVLFHRDPEALEGARLGGLLGPQGRPKWPIRGAITIPYYRRGICTMVRTRKLAGAGGRKYFAPSGVGLFAGGEATLYNADILDDPALGEVVLTEGEFKALLAWQHGVPAVAQPGIGYLPDEYLEALARRVVVIAYDVEARRDPFTLSPGERFTIKAGERLTGLDLKRELGQAKDALEAAKLRAKTGDVDVQSEVVKELGIIEGRFHQLHAGLQELQALRLGARVLRLPRPADEPKVDLDGYILRHGGDALRALVQAAPSAEDWHARHHGGGYSYERGGISNGKPIANYQARIVETVFQSDGQALTALQRLALRTPGGRILRHDISDEDWADDRAARQAIRVGLREGTFHDDPREVLPAIRLLSNQGDAPVERTVITATGWERIAERWHFLSSDGAVAADGVAANVRAQIDPEATGNHYALCGPGDPAAGSQAWLKFLRGEVCPQPLALILAAQAALPLIHRFSGDTGRTMVWLFHQSGALKTALTRASVMALYGPAFTAERADGAPVPKWDATSVGLGLLVFYYRDMPILIDDYKQGVIHPEQFKKFLHNYSESTGRTRGTKDQRVERVKPARCIVFATAEDLPSIGDYGMEARLLALQLHPSATNPDALAELQRAGSAGHLAAFWRGFIQQLAGELDRLGEAGVRARIQESMRGDEERLPGHRRAQGALRQNRAAWLVLSAWLVQAGLIGGEERERLNAAHLEARALLAQVLTERQRDSKPATIFLNVLNELVQGGELLLEQPGMRCPRCESDLVFTDQAWFCTGKLGPNEIPCPYTIPADKCIGFILEDGSIGLQADRAFRAVSRVRNDQRQPFTFTSTAIWQQLDADGHLVGKGGDGRYQVQRRNPARRGRDGYALPMKVIHLKASAFGPSDDGDPGPEGPDRGDDRDQGVEIMGSMGSMGSNTAPAHQDAIWPSTGHGIEWDQTGGGMGSAPAASPPLIPSDPIRSHAWDQSFGAWGRAKPDLDPIDPIKPHPCAHVAPDDVRPPVDLPPAITDSLWHGAVKAHLAGNDVIVNRIATGRGLTYEALHGYITRALEAHEGSLP